MSHESPYIRHFFIDDTLVPPSSEGVLSFIILRPRLLPLDQDLGSYLRQD